jgi:hypothetical protein
VKLNNNQAGELATRLAICPQAIEEAIRRGLLSFVKHRNSRCWRFGDARNGSFRRIDGDPFRINGDCVKAAAATRGESWHRLIGLGDVQANDRRDILLTLEGSKDALAALHFADAEGTLPHVGIVASLGAGINPPADDLEKLRGHRVRIIADVDKSGVQAAARIAECLTCVAAEVQIFSLAGLKRDDGLPVKDLFDLSRIDYDNFEANRDLWSITDLNSKGSRVQVITEKQKFFPLPLPPPHESPESHGFPVYPVSNAQELERELQELADRNACIARNTARRQRWQLLRDLKAVEKGISRKLVADELIHAFNRWYTVSAPHLDPKKTRDDYCGLFLAELGKVRVPTGEGEALKKALERVLALSVHALPILPGIAEAPESWRRLAALQGELARQSPNGTYFLSCRDAAKAHPRLNKDSALSINHALVRLGVIEFVRVGDARPGGKASEFRYKGTARLEPKRGQDALTAPVWKGDPGDARLTERRREK